MTSPIVNLDQLDFLPWTSRFGPDNRQPPESYGAETAALGARVGAVRLGCNVTRIAPGKAAFPAHNHRVVEEMFLVLRGTGEVRIGQARHVLRQGDVIACPPGGPETAHQIRNTGDEPLEVLCVSTVESADLVEYPDSGKIGFAAWATGEDGRPQLFRTMVRADPKANYWDGE